MKEAIRIIVRGPSQGVGLRYQVRGCAVALGLAGWVRNLPNGAFEVHAEGEPDQLRSFQEQVAAPSTYALVQHLDVKQVPAEGLTSFEIRR